MSESLVLIYAIVHDNRNMLRVQRRCLRDSFDPFSIPEARFMELFRLNKAACLALLEELSPHLKTGVRKTFVSKSVRLTAALHFYSTGSFLRDIGQDFVCPLSKTMISRIVHEVTEVIVRKLMNKYVKFPSTDADFTTIQQRFYAVTGFPGVIGAIDCTHVKIKKPSQDVERCYRNRKGYFSKNVQLISDYDLNILGCFGRFGGSTHDAFIWNNSQAKAFLEEKHASGMSNIWLIGDSGYPLQPWLMTPIGNPEDTAEIMFNEAHIRARNCVERLNGVLKKTFACLSHDRGLMVTPQFAGSVINACCTLHNYRKKYNIPLPDVEIVPQNEPIDENSSVQNNNLAEGRRIRQTIVRNYFSN